MIEGPVFQMCLVPPIAIQICCSFLSTMFQVHTAGNYWPKRLGCHLHEDKECFCEQALGMAVWFAISKGWFILIHLSFETALTWAALKYSLACLCFGNWLYLAVSGACLATKPLHCTLCWAEIRKRRVRDQEWRKGPQITYGKDCGSHGCEMIIIYYCQCSSNLCFVVMFLLSVIFHTDKRKTPLEVMKWECHPLKAGTF